MLSFKNKKMMQNTIKNIEKVVYKTKPKTTKTGNRKTGMYLNKLRSNTCHNLNKNGEGIEVKKS